MQDTHQTPPDTFQTSLNTTMQDTSVHAKAVIVPSVVVAGLIDVNRDTCDVRYQAFYQTGQIQLRLAEQTKAYFLGFLI